MNLSPLQRRVTPTFASDRPPKCAEFRGKKSRGSYYKTIQSNELDRLERREFRLIREENRLIADTISYARGEQLLADLADAIAEFLHPVATCPTTETDLSNDTQHDNFR
jgi:hypothetical protein